MGGRRHLKLNIDARPIANKYREGKMKRTLERELKVPENAQKEANETSSCRRIVVALELRCFLRLMSTQVRCLGKTGHHCGSLLVQQSGLIPSPGFRLACAFYDSVIRITGYSTTQWS